MPSKKEVWRVELRILDINKCTEIQPKGNCSMQDCMECSNAKILEVENLE